MANQTLAPAAAVITTGTPLLTAPEDYFHWEESIRNDLKGLSLLWTIEEPLRQRPNRQILEDENIGFGFTGAQARPTGTDVRKAVHEYQKDLDKALSHIISKVDPGQRSTITAASTPTECLAAISALFKKQDPAAAMDIIFKLMKMNPPINEVSSFVHQVKEAHNQLKLMKADNLLTVDVICQGILLDKLQDAPSHTSFILQQKSAWTSGNTDVTVTGLSILQYSESVSRAKKETPAAMTVQLPQRKRSRARTDLEAPQSLSSGPPKYTGPWCQYKKCQDTGMIKHAPDNCLWQDPGKAPDYWLKKNMPDYVRRS